MRMPVVVVLLLAAAVAPSWAQAPSVEVRAAWLRRAPVVAGDTGATAAAYLTIDNRTRTSEALLSVTTDASERVEIHETRWMSGMAMMEPVRRLSIAPNSSVEMKPGGIHLMLIGLRRPLGAGDRITFELVFAHAGTVRVQADVR
jgi:copper(I)-binding protein